MKTKDIVIRQHPEKIPASDESDLLQEKDVDIPDLRPVSIRLRIMAADRGKQKKPATMSDIGITGRG